MSSEVEKIAIETLLPANVVKHLQDKLYEKRKVAAVEIDKLVREYAPKEGVEPKIRALIEGIREGYVQSRSVNARKGGLMALGYMAVALTEKRIVLYLPLLLRPVLEAFNDRDQEVRFAAIESVYNIAKVSRGEVLAYFDEIFDGICTFANSKDENASGGSLILDRLLKDIYTESKNINVDKFIATVVRRIHAVNSSVRLVILNWIELLSLIPNVELLPYLPLLADGLFTILGDSLEDVRKVSVRILGGFLNDIKEGIQIYDYSALMAKSLHYTGSSSPLTVEMALQLLDILVDAGRDGRIDDYTAEILLAVLPLGDGKNLQAIASDINLKLLDTFQRTDQKANVGRVAATLKNFLGGSEQTSEFVQRNSMRWLKLLNQKYPEETLPHLRGMFPFLLKVLREKNEEVISLALEIVSFISENELYFSLFLSSILEVFKETPAVFEERGEFIIRVLCRHIGDIRVLNYLSRIVATEKSDEFAGKLVRTLNIILFMAEETLTARRSLKRLSEKQNREEVFLSLYPSWCRDASAVLALCLYAGQYELARSIVREYAVRQEIGVDSLLQMDKLIQLLESPQFLRVRMHILEPFNYHDLHYSLFAILQFFPQNETFHKLNHRLECSRLFLDSGILPIFSKGGAFKKDGSVNVFSSSEVSSFTGTFVEHCEKKLGGGETSS